MLMLTAGIAHSHASSAPLPGVTKTRVLLILDCSNSMWDHWQSNSKIKVTQQVLLSFLDSMANQTGTEVALRVFGHLNRDAYGTRLEVPFGPSNVYRIQSKLKTLVPQGGCTMASALTNSLNDFPSDPSSRNLILIITDGIDDCDGSICQVARQVQESGRVVQTFILGIGNIADRGADRMDCAGRFTAVPDEEQFARSLYDIFHLSEDEARVVVQLTDAGGHLYETSIPLTLSDSRTGATRLATCYAVDQHFVSDTLVVDPLPTYDLTLHTFPPQTVPACQFAPGETTLLSLVVEQGSLRLHHEQRRSQLAIPHYPVVVRPHDNPDLEHMTTVGETQSYVAGRYDIEVLSTPAIRLNDVSIQAQSATDLTIPMPGQLSLQKPRGATAGYIVSVGSGSAKQVGTLNNTLTSERILLMPGEYIVVLRSANATAYETTVSKRVKIEPGLTTNINF